MSHQSYLEAPYDQRANRGEAFEWFCEKYGVDPEDPDADQKFEDYCEDMEEDIALRKAEERAERDRERWDNFERDL